MNASGNSPFTEVRALTVTTSVVEGPATGPGKGPPTVSSAAVVLVGRLDAVEAPAVRAELARLLASGASTLVVDLAAVSFIDSAGLAALVRARRDVQRVGGDVVLISPSDPDALRVFRLTQFDQVFRMVDSRVDA